MNFKYILWMSKQFTDAPKWTVARWANINQATWWRLWAAFILQLQAAHSH